jgi:uncharacterized membrane protein YidH (DUF202 family)
VEVAHAIPLRKPNDMTADPNADIQRNKIEARQGTDRPKNNYVLVISLGLVIVVFALVWLFLRH